MSLKEWLRLLSGTLFIVGFIPYIIATIQGGRQGKPGPKKVSWLIWMSLDWINMIGMIRKRAEGLGQIIGVSFGGLIVLATVFKYGQKGWEPKDRKYLIAAIAGIIFLFVAPSLAILTSCAVTFMASKPTFENWRNENLLAWSIYWVSCALGVAGIPNLTFDPASLALIEFKEAAQPVTFFVIETIMMTILLYHHKERTLSRCA